MKHIALSRIVLALAMINPVTLPAAFPGVLVQVSNFSSTDGTVEVSLFDSAETFLVTPYLQQSGPVAEDGSYTTYFASVPEGEYAVVVVHDANNNGQLDLGFLDIGGEDYGYSNNVRPWFGRPEFEEAKFTVSDADAIVEIDLGNH